MICALRIRMAGLITESLVPDAEGRNSRFFFGTEIRMSGVCRLQTKKYMCRTKV